jgi:hypothetical protein
MPQGLQVWDTSGTLIIDTSTYVLKSITSVVAEATTTAAQEVTVLPPGTTNLIAASASIESGSAPQDVIDVNYDVTNDKLQYKFKDTGSYFARINALAY